MCVFLSHRPTLTSLFLAAEERTHATKNLNSTPYVDCSEMGKMDIKLDSNILVVLEIMALFIIYNYQWIRSEAISQHHSFAIRFILIITCFWCST